MPLNRRGVYYYSTTVFTAFEVPPKKDGGSRGCPPGNTSYYSINRGSKGVQGGVSLGMPLLRKDYINNRISLSTYLTYPALKHKSSRTCPHRIYSLRSDPFKIGGGSKGCLPRNASSYSTIYSPRSDRSKADGV
jgi:hypothetical protein